MFKNTLTTHRIERRAANWHGTPLDVVRVMRTLTPDQMRLFDILLADVYLHREAVDKLEKRCGSLSGRLGNRTIQLRHLIERIREMETALAVANRKLSKQQEGPTR